MQFHVHVPGGSLTFESTRETDQALVARGGEIKAQQAALTELAQPALQALATILVLAAGAKNRPAALVATFGRLERELLTHLDNVHHYTQS